MEENDYIWGNETEKGQGCAAKMRKCGDILTIKSYTEIETQKVLH